MKILHLIHHIVLGPSEYAHQTYPKVKQHHERFLKAIEIICRVALIGFAAYCAPVPFAISFSVGVVIGAGYALLAHHRKLNWTAVSNVMPACAQNFMEFLSQTKFPASVARIVTAVFIGAHIRHDPVFFVPFCSVFLGFGVGKDIVLGSVSLTGRTFTTPVPHKASCCS